MKLTKCLHHSSRCLFPRMYRFLLCKIKKMLFNSNGDAYTHIYHFRVLKSVIIIILSTISLRPQDSVEKYFQQRNDLHVNNCAFLVKSVIISSSCDLRYGTHEPWMKKKCIQAHLITQFETPAFFTGATKKKHRNEMHATNWNWMNYIVAKVLNFEWLRFQCTLTKLTKLRRECTT